MVTRREAVRRLGGLAAGAFGCGALGWRCAAREEAPTPLGPLGVQLYTLRAEMEGDLEGTLDRVAAIGYREVEFAGYFGRTPAQIRDALRASGLTAPGAHVGLDVFTDHEALVEAADTIGHDYLIVPWIPIEQRATLDDWRRVAGAFNEAAQLAATADIQFAYHNHDFEFTPVEGRIPFDVLCEATDPELVKIELDLFWIIHGGGDPLAFFQRWPGRVPLVHVKDRTADGSMVDVGAGVIDWRGIFARRGEAGMRHYFVEHDEPGDPFASVTASYTYLHRLEV